MFEGEDDDLPQIDFEALSSNSPWKITFKMPDQLEEFETKRLGVVLKSKLELWMGLEDFLDHYKLNPLPTWANQLVLWSDSFHKKDLKIFNVSF